MRDLGDVLELLRTSPQRWDTLRLAGREWRHLARSHEAWERWVAALQGHSGGSSVMTFTAKRDQAEGEEPEESVERWRLWRAKPDRIRTQFQVSMETVTAVLIGSEWWSWTPSAGLRTNGGDPSSTHGVGPAEILVDTPELLSVIRVRAVSRTTFRSRSAYLVSAEPAKADWNAPPSVLHALGAGADNYQLEVDAETGLLLSTQAELGGQPFRMVDIEEFGLNEQLDESLFTPSGLGV